MMGLECAFCQIVRGERSARVVGDSPDALAFFPLRPVSPGHTIVIPKTHIRDLWADGTVPAAGLMQAVIQVGQAIGKALRPEGMNLISSAGQAASQTVPHLHLHVVPRWPGDPMGNLWPPSPSLDGDLLDQTAAAVRDAYRAVSAGSPSEARR
jgi:histidine triad (HIT) family protein